jgi:hypothetical protein
VSPTDPLAQLHPLREPALIGWWPLAPGWWLLLALALLLLAAGAWYLYRRHRRNAYRRLALRQLDSIQQQYAKERNTQQAVHAINVLLKGVALKAYSRREIAAISGETWCEFLRSSAPAGPAFEPTMLSAQYRPEAGELDIEALIRAARHWISRHEVAR